MVAEVWIVKECGGHCVFNDKGSALRPAKVRQLVNGCTNRADRGEIFGSMTARPLDPRAEREDPPQPIERPY